MKEQLLHAWQTANAKNILLLEHLPEDRLQAAASGKGRNVAAQLAHVHNVRINWTEFVAKEVYDPTLLLAKDAVLTNTTLLRAFELSAKKIEGVIDTSWEKDGKLPSFKAGLIPFISYLIAHESHHRGNILLTLKLDGFKLPDALKWGLWEW